VILAEIALGLAISPVTDLKEQDLHGIVRVARRVRSRSGMKSDITSNISRRGTLLFQLYGLA
jgi:hypothetical protein